MQFYTIPNSIQFDFSNLSNIQRTILINTCYPQILHNVQIFPSAVAHIFYSSIHLRETYCSSEQHQQTYCYLGLIGHLAVSFLLNAGLGSYTMQALCVMVPSFCPGSLKEFALVCRSLQTISCKNIDFFSVSKFFSL